MKYLLDTHLLLWSTYRTARLSLYGRQMLEAYAGSLCFSTISMVEIAIKQRLGKLELDVNLSELQATLISMGMSEVRLTGEHALVLSTLPQIHRDPFDRLLLAQTIAEGMTLLTADKLLLNYTAAAQYLK